MSDSAPQPARQRATPDTATAQPRGRLAAEQAVPTTSVIAAIPAWRLLDERADGQSARRVVVDQQCWAILGLQHTVGNAAVQRLLVQRHRIAPEIPLVQREPEQPAKKPLQEPNTGVIVEPGELKPGVLGSSVPLPSSLQMRKPPGSGRGAALTAPSFVLKIDPRGMVGGILDRVDLGGFSLINPTVVFNPKSDTLTGEATVSIPDAQYPAHLVGPTDIKVRVTSSTPGKFTAEADYGPFVADFTLTLDYDTAPIEKILKAVMSGDVASGIGQLGDVQTDVGFKARGTLGVGTQKYRLPLTAGGVSGRVGPRGASWRGGAAGAILVPAGTFHPDLTAPGVGGTYSAGKRTRSGGGSGTSAMAAVTGTPSIEAISKGDLGGVFKPFLYAQITHATRTAKGHVLGIRLSAHYRLGGGAGPVDPLDQAREKMQEDRYRLGGDAKTRPSIDPAVTNKWADMQGGGRDEQWRGGIEVFGTFDFLGGK
jgi:hypothetical protein